MLKGNTGTSDMRNIMKKWQQKHATTGDIRSSKVPLKNKFRLLDKKPFTMHSPRGTSNIPASPRDLQNSLIVSDMNQRDY